MALSHRKKTISTQVRDQSRAFFLIKSVTVTLQQLQKQIAFDTVAKRHNQLCEEFKTIKAELKNHTISDLKSKFNTLKAKHAALQSELKLALQPDPVIDLSMPPIAQAFVLTSQLNRLQKEDKLITALGDAEAKRTSVDQAKKLIAYEKKIGELLLIDFAFAHNFTDANRAAERAELDRFQKFVDMYFAKELCKEELPDALCVEPHILAATTSRINEMQQIAKQIEQHFAKNPRWKFTLQRRKAALSDELVVTQRMISGIEKRMQRQKERPSEARLRPRLPTIEMPFVGSIFSASVGLPMFLVAISALSSNPVGWAFGLLVCGLAALALTVYLFHLIYKQVDKLAYIKSHEKRPALQAQIIEQDNNLQLESKCLNQISYETRMQLIDNGILIHSQFPDKFKRRGYKIASPDAELQPCSMMTPVKQWVQGRHKMRDVSDVSLVYNRRTRAVMFPAQPGEVAAPVPLAKTRREIETQMLSRRQARPV